MNIELFTRFAPIIRNLSASELAGSSALYGKLSLAKHGDIEVCYVPFEFINHAAKVVIVGITPGRTQFVNAIQEARRQLDNGASAQVALTAAKQFGAFSGNLRPSLVKLLDYVGINTWLGLKSCDDLFGTAAHLVQTTSALRNPVFIKGENYKGTPSISTPFLKAQLASFSAEAQALPKAVFVPLGKQASRALTMLATQGLVEPGRVLAGLPHPSGENAERIAYFLGTKDRSTLSAKTNSSSIDQAKAEIIGKIKALQH